MKKLFNLLFLVVLVFCAIIGYKLFLLNRYSSDKVDINTDTIFNKKLEVLDIYSTKISINSVLYGTYFTNYEKSNTDNGLYVLYDSNHQVKSYYSANIIPQYVTVLSYKYDNQNNQQNLKIKEFFKNNNINNDIDLLQYIKNNYYCQSSILSSTSTIKNNSMINEFVADTLPLFESIDLIEDNYGYIININNNLKELHILYEDKQYIITLGGEDLTKDYFINSFIGSLVFDN